MLHANSALTTAAIVAAMSTRHGATGDAADFLVFAGVATIITAAIALVLIVIAKRYL